MPSKTALTRALAIADRCNEHCGIDHDWLSGAIADEITDAVAEAQGQPPTPIVDEVLIELGNAIAKHAPMHSAHEGYAVIKEELEEAWDEIKKRDPDPALLRAEMVQVAAMALRFLGDVCDKGER